MNLFELKKEYEIKLIEKDKIDDELKNYKDKVNQVYNVFNNYNDYEKQIYIEKKFYKWSNAKISIKHNGMDRATIYRIVKKIEKSETMQHRATK